MSEELFKIISDQLTHSGCDEHSFTITESDVLVDDDFIRSVLVDIKFKPYNTDEGEVTPKEVCLEFQFNKEENEHCLIIGEDTETSITYGNLFASMYFSAISHPNTIENNTGE